MSNTQPIPTNGTPIADSIPAPTTGPVDTTAVTPVEQESPANWSPDITAITTAHGDPTVWAHQFYELVGHVTGKWIDEQSLEEWLTSFAQQVTVASFRSAFFDLANTQVPANTTGDPALQLLQFRDDLARGFRVRAGL